MVGLMRLLADKGLVRLECCLVTPRCTEQLSFMLRISRIFRGNMRLRFARIQDRLGIE